MGRSNSEAAVERRVRRIAQRRGLSLLKAQKPNAKIVAHGGYKLRDDESSEIVFGHAGYEFSADLEEIEAFLLGGQDEA